MVPLIFLDVKVGITFLDLVKEEARQRVCIQRKKRQNKELKKIDSCPNAKTKIEIMLFDVKMQQNWCP